MASNKRPPLEIDEITNNLKQSSGKGIGAFFPSQLVQQTDKKLERVKIADSPTALSVNDKPKEEEGKVVSKHASMLADKELIETIRKAVKHPGKEVTYVRLTKQEKSELGDIIYIYKKQDIITSENEIARIGLRHLIENYKANGRNSLLAKVIQALNG